MASRLQLDASPAGKILHLLCQRAPCSMQDLVAWLGVTRTAVRQQLTVLCSRGLVATSRVRQERGRPRTVYSLSEQGRACLPQLSEGLACVLLEAVMQPSASAHRDELLRRVGAHLGRHYAAHVQGPTPAVRLQELAAWLAEEGIASQISRDEGGLALEVYGCPYYRVARQHREVCRLETAAIAQAIGAPATLARSQLDGYHCCRFRIQPPPPA